MPLQTGLKSLIKSASTVTCGGDSTWLLEALRCQHTCLMIETMMPTNYDLASHIFDAHTDCNIPRMDSQCLKKATAMPFSD